MMSSGKFRYFTNKIVNYGTLLMGNSGFREKDVWVNNVGTRIYLNHDDSWPQQIYYVLYFIQSNFRAPF